MAALAHPEPWLEGEETECERGVVETVLVALHGGARDAAVTCNAGDVHDLTVVEGGNGQEARESRQVSDQRLCPDFLAEVEPVTALKHRAPFVGNSNRGDGSRVERKYFVEVVAEFRGRHGMHGLVQRPAREQIDSFRLESSRARSGKSKFEPTILNVPVHLVKGIGKTPDLVDHHSAVQRRELEIDGEEGRMGKVVLASGLVDEVDMWRIGKVAPRPGTLANPTNAEEEAALPGHPGKSGIWTFCGTVVIFR